MNLRPICYALLPLVLAACHEEPAPPAVAPARVTSAPAPAVVATVAARPVLRSKSVIFAGKLPCPGCSSDAELTLQRDELGQNSYVLKQTIQRDGQTSNPMETGHWRLEVDRADDPPLALLYLESGRPGHGLVFSIALDGRLEPLDGSSDTSLKHQRGDLDLDALYAQKLAAPNAAAKAGSTP